jgi:hypothetical protein
MMWWTVCFSAERWMGMGLPACQCIDRTLPRPFSDRHPFQVSSQPSLPLPLLVLWGTLPFLRMSLHCPLPTVILHHIPVYVISHKMPSRSTLPSTNPKLIVGEHSFITRFSLHWEKHSSGYCITPLHSWRSRPRQISSTPSSPPLSLPLRHNPLVKETHEESGIRGEIERQLAWNVRISHHILFLPLQQPPKNMTNISSQYYIPY